MHRKRLRGDDAEGSSWRQDETPPVRIASTVVVVGLVQILPQGDYALERRSVYMGECKEEPIIIIIVDPKKRFRGLCARQQQGAC